MQWLAAAQGQSAFDLEVSEGTAEAVAERWRRGRCDVALFPSRAAAVDAANAIALWREPYLLAAAANHLVGDARSLVGQGSRRHAVHPARRLRGP